MTRLLGSLLVLLVALLTINAAGLYHLYANGMLVRFKAIPESAFDALGRDRPLRPLPDTAFFRSRLEAAGHPEGILELLRWTMNQVGSAELRSPGSARRALEIAEAGKGLSCGLLAAIFQHVLATQGHTTREVQLARSLFSSADTHITTEVLVDGRWTLFDPTFHVSFAQDGHLLGAADIRRASREGTHDEVEPVFHGEVRYPVRLETYDHHWLPLYNNVAVLQAPDAMWHRLPPFRYWYGPKYYVLEGDPDPLWHVSAMDRLYFLYVGFLPIAAVVLAFLVAGIGVSGSRSSRAVRR